MMDYRDYDDDRDDITFVSNNALLAAVVFLMADRPRIDMAQSNQTGDYVHITGKYLNSNQSCSNGIVQCSV